MIQEEKNRLLETLKGCTTRPGMYSINPENLEVLTKHLVHIYLMISNTPWTLQSTETLWTEVAKSLGYGEKFAIEFFETNEFRDRKWGNKEKIARQAIVGAFQNIWNNITPTNLHIAQWVKFLLENPEILGSPDSIDVVLSSLMELADGNDNGLFRKLYAQECLRLKGSAHRGLLDFNTKDDWQFVPYKFDENGYARVTAGIDNVINQIQLIE